jgi:carbon monoxide dehydrogenase subunit G
MQLTDSQRIAAPRETVWAALNDPEVLRACIPGCESLQMTSPTAMTAKVTLKVGPVKATFGGTVTLSEIDPPNGYRITGEGSGGVAGFAKGGAVVRLEADGPDATILSYDVDAQIGGKLAQLGARLIDGTARKLAGEFFAKFGDVVAPPVEDAAGATGDGETAATTGWFNRVFKKSTTPAALALALGLALGIGHVCCLGGEATAHPMPDGSICRANLA